MQALRASGVLNLNITEGGINKWLEVYPPEPCLLASPGIKSFGSTEQFQYDFLYAVGSQSRSAHPDSIRTQPWVTCPSASTANEHLMATSQLPAPTSTAGFSYVKKAKLQRKVAAKGGCG